ncbi:putative hydroxymethylpyrimidine/phosphomethylpyrimidine kinase 2 [Zalerion maritima]|uniref:Hydroxymethylpyrimidine/phosphomethylpyrimidine kinase 2 n=1 Tax=Zalerion maritima TaxID=339359 RepID=A0AAD5RRM5_9PEZI|nr:putative hydroxymethylpyrimidine/phosphomethylpyrimidine kinase 2 [Zalerion maritima]
MVNIEGKVLVIAGSDPSGGAGLEADQKVLAAHGVYAMTATTALTAQNTTGVYGIHVTPCDFLRKQIDAVADDIPPDVVKMGMLSGSATIKTVAKAVKDHELHTIVLDPVMVSTSGAALLDPESVSDLRVELLPLATVATPNAPEAKLLLKDAGMDVPELSKVEDLEVLGRSILKLGPKWVLVKGGHCPFTSNGVIAQTENEKQMVVDVLAGPSNESSGKADNVVFRITSAYQGRGDTHGTGCSLASAIAANLARGRDVPSAVRAACRYVEAGIRTAPGLGKGAGPLNHFHSLQVLPFAPGRFVDYLLNRPDVVPVWNRFVYHPFVMALGDGTLPIESFKGYLVQDYLYLVHFARANALASYKAKNMKDVAACAAIVTHISHEMTLHLDYCSGFGIPREGIESTEERKECTAYVLDIGQSEDWLGLQVALAPCLLGYGAVAQMLIQHPETENEGNVYLKWIKNYVADDYVEAVKAGQDLLERHALLQAPTRIEKLVKIFIHATKMEIGFWEMFPHR